MGKSIGGCRVLKLTCLPIARRMPAVTAPRPSNTWKSATMGRMAATSSTTSADHGIRGQRFLSRRGDILVRRSPGSSLKICAHDLRKTINIAL